jgi:hypothetical protein
MEEIIIDAEFKALLPALDAQTYALLEESMLENGCMHPLILWNGILIDGHNRYEISQRHGIPFNTISKEFDSRDDVLIWIVSTQIARRNLSPMQLSFFRGLHYRADRRIQGTNNQYAQESENRQSDGFQKSTARRLAEQYNVSSRTIERDARVAEAISAIGESSPEAKKNILSGAAGISRRHLQELAVGPQDAITEVAASIEEGTFERRGAAPPDENGSETPVYDAMELLNTAIAKMADYLRADMQQLHKQRRIEGKAKKSYRHSGRAIQADLTAKLFGDSFFLKHSSTHITYRYALPTYLMWMFYIHTYTTCVPS